MDADARRNPRIARTVDAGEADRGSGHVPAESRQPLEMRVSRFAGEGLHEDIDFTNYTKDATHFNFATSRRSSEGGRPARPPHRPIELEPRATWHLGIDFAHMRPCHRCRAFGVTGERQKIFLAEAATFATRESGTLAAVVEEALEHGATNSRGGCCTWRTPARCRR